MEACTRQVYAPRWYDGGGVLDVASTTRDTASKGHSAHTSIHSAKLATFRRGGQSGRAKPRDNILLH